MFLLPLNFICNNSPMEDSQPTLVINVEQQPSVAKGRKKTISVLTGILPVWKN